MKIKANKSKYIKKHTVIILYSNINNGKLNFL